MRRKANAKHFLECLPTTWQVTRRRRVPIPNEEEGKCEAFLGMPSDDVAGDAKASRADTEKEE